jgi:hypothetical protein
LKQVGVIIQALAAEFPGYAGQFRCSLKEEL